MSYSCITSTNLTKNTVTFNMSIKETNSLENLAKANLKRNNDLFDHFGGLEENEKGGMSTRSTFVLVNSSYKPISELNTENNNNNLIADAKGEEVKNITFYFDSKNNQKEGAMYRFETEPHNQRSDNENEPIYLPTFASCFSSCSLNKRKTKTFPPYINYSSSKPKKVIRSMPQFQYDTQIVDTQILIDTKQKENEINEIELVQEPNNQIYIEAPEENKVNSNSISAIKVDEDAHYIKDSQIKHNNSSLINSFLIMNNKKSKENFNMLSCDYGIAGLNNSLRLNNKIVQSPRLTSSHSKLLADDLAVYYLSRTPQYNVNYDLMGKNFHISKNKYDKGSEEIILSKHNANKSNFAHNLNRNFDQLKSEEWKVPEYFYQINNNKGTTSKDAIFQKTNSLGSHKEKIPIILAINQNSISGGSIDISNKFDDDSLNFYQSKNCINFHFQESIVFSNIDKLKSCLIQLDTISNDFFHSGILNLSFIFNFLDDIENLELFDVRSKSGPYFRAPIILAEVKRSSFYILASIGLYIILNHRIANKELIKNFVQSQNFNLKEALSKLDSIYCHLILASRTIEGEDECKLNNLKYDLRKRKSIERHPCSILSRPTQGGLLNPLNISIAPFIIKLNNSVHSLNRQIIYSLNQVKGSFSKVNILTLNSIIKMLKAIKVESLSNFKDFIIDEILYEVNFSNHKYLADCHISDILSINLDLNVKENIKSDDCSSMEIDLENMKILNVEQSNSMQLYYLPSLSIKEYTLIIELEQVLSFTVKSNEESYFILRPNLEYFINTLCEFCEIVVFTTLTKEKADLIINKFDTGNVSYRLYKQHAIQKDGILIKVILYFYDVGSSSFRSTIREVSNHRQ